MKIENASTTGDLDVPLLAREGEPYDEHGDGCVNAGEVVDVTEANARILLQQRGVWLPSDDEAKKLLEQLDAEAQDQAVDTGVVNAVPYEPEPANIETPADELAMPALSAPKAAWVAWGAHEGDPDPRSKTKPQLVELYGPSDEES